jgi:hypothetical protein
LQSKSEIERENFLLELAAQGKSEPEPPAPYLRLIRLKRYSIMTYSGGLYNQPHIELMEFDAVQRAINEYEHIQLVNARIQAEAIDERNL